MAVVNRPPPPFFNRGPAPLARLIFYVLLSLLLVVADLRLHVLEWARSGLELATYPLQRLAYAPVQGIEEGSGYLSSLVKLQQENQQLREQQLKAANLLLRQDHLELENQRLRALLDMKARQPVDSQIAEILYAARDPFSRKLILNRGSQQGVQEGQIVVDEQGVIGQVTRVYPLLSELTLISDQNQAVPVQVVRNGLRGVLFGSGDGNLELRFLDANADVKEDDLLVTSGLDGLYLPGLPVALVKQVDREAAYAFARIRCEPVAGVEHHGMVLILGLRVPPLPPPADWQKSATEGRAATPASAANTPAVKSATAKTAQP